jgi:HD-like signal output (HDOD) protein
MRSDAMEANRPAPEPEKIEDRVLALPGIVPGDPPALFRDFIEKITPRLTLGDTSYSILKAFSNIDVTAEKVAQSLKSNHYYQYYFMQTIEGLSKRTEVPSLDGAVVLLGMQGSRNLVIALQLLRTVRGGGHAELDKDGKVKVAAKDTLRYALKAEEFLTSQKLPYADTGYAAGLIFDYLAALGAELVEDKKKIANYVEQVFLHGMKTAQIAREINEALPESSFTKYIFASALIHDVGKIAMAILDPAYFAFLDEVQKRDAPRAVRDFAERKRFGVHHATLGGLICHYFRIFRPVEKAILHHHEPYLLRDLNRNLYQLSALISLSSNVANHFKRVDKLDDPVLAQWKGLDLEDFRIDLRAVMKAVTRVV